MSCETGIWSVIVIHNKTVFLLFFLFGVFKDTIWLQLKYFYVIFQQILLAVTNTKIKGNHFIKIV